MAGITKANGAQILPKFCDFVPTADGGTVNGVEFRWTKAGNFPTNGAARDVLRASEAYMNAYPTKAKGMPSAGTRAPRSPMDPEYWAGKSPEDCDRALKAIAAGRVLAAEQVAKGRLETARKALEAVGTAKALEALKVLQG